MDRAAELARLYDEALALTEQLGMAIASHSWADLDPLLDERAQVIARLEPLMAQGPLADPAPLAERLQRLIALDAANARELDARRAEVGTRLRGLATSRTALSGYAGAAVGAEAVFVDADR